MDENAMKLAEAVQNLINEWMKNNPGKWPELDITRNIARVKGETSITVSVMPYVDNL